MIPKSLRSKILLELLIESLQADLARKNSTHFHEVLMDLQNLAIRFDDVKHESILLGLTLVRDRLEKLYSDEWKTQD